MSRTAADPLAVLWEGPFAAALVNRALCQCLIQRGHRLVIGIKSRSPPPWKAIEIEVRLPACGRTCTFRDILTVRLPDRAGGL